MFIIGAMGWKGYVFEASVINTNILEKSICLNDFNIKVINKAVYDKTGNIYFGQHGPFGLIQNEVTAGILWEEIPCVCLDDWCKQEDVPEKINLIKMDIEEYVQNTDDVISFILKHLSIDTPNHVLMTYCYVLKDYPDYVSNIQIKDKLEKIAEIKKQDKFINKYLGWFIQ